MEERTNQKHSSPLICSFAFPGPSYRQAAGVWKQVIFLRYRQKVKSSQPLSPSAYITDLTSSPHTGILSSHIFTRRASTEQYFEREHAHITFIIAYGCNYSILILLSISYCANVQIKVYHRHVCIGKNTVDRGLGTICSCRHPPGSWNISPADGGGGGG